MTEGSTSEKKIDPSLLNPNVFAKTTSSTLKKRGSIRFYANAGYPVPSVFGTDNRWREQNQMSKLCQGNRHTIMCLIGSQDRIPNYWSGSSVMRNISGPLTLLW